MHLDASLKSGGGLFLLALACLLTGCHSTKTVFRQPDFDAATLNSGGLAIVAVTRPEEQDYYAAPYIAEHTETQFRSQWPALKIVPMKTVQEMLGPEKQMAVQEAFRERAVLHPDQLALLESLTNSVRYALLIDVRQDHADGGYGESAAKVEEYERDPETGENRLVRQDTEYTASWSHSRSMRTLFVVYDLYTREHVWITFATGSGKYSNSKTSSGGFPYVAQSAGISPQELMDAITRRAVRKLPVTAAKTPSAKKPVAAGE